MSGKRKPAKGDAMAKKVHGGGIGKASLKSAAAGGAVGDPLHYYLATGTFARISNHTVIGHVVKFVMTVGKNNTPTAAEMNMVARAKWPQLAGHICLSMTLVQIRREVFERYGGVTNHLTDLEERGPDNELMTILSAL
jgi:hypothetical protein